MKCSKCGKEISTTNVFITEDDEPLCEKCFSKYYELCRQCNVAIPKGQGLCNTCQSVVFKKVINNYSTKVNGIFKNRNTDSTKCLNDRYFGYEMEYSHTNATLAKLIFNDLYRERLIYNKSDGSLCGGGVEIVTIPMTGNNINKLIDRMDFDTFKSLSGRNMGENAGVHIHVSRNTISPIDVVKLSLLFNGSDSTIYKNYIYYLVGRRNDSTGLEDVSYNSSSSDHYYAIGQVQLSKVVREDYTSSHGLALNLGNKHTIEFRIFKSSTNKEQLKSYLEFTQKAIEFAEINPINMISIPNFITFLSLSARNSWLVGRLNKLKEKYPLLFNIKPVDYSVNKYMDKIKDMNYKDLEYCLDKLPYIDRRVLPFEKEWTKDLIKTLYSNHGTTYKNKIISNLNDIVKKGIIKEILHKS